MSVRRRLVLSNMLMLILPIIIMVATAACIWMIYAGLNDGRNTRAMNNGSALFHRMEETDRLAQKWQDGSSLEEVKQEIDRFHRQNGKTGVTLSFYSVADAEADPIHHQKHLLVTDAAAEYRVPVGDYVLLLSDPTFTLNEQSRNQPLMVGIVLFLMLVATVLFTNWFLTRFVFNSIMNPIRTLVDGVDQLRDGNLEYRILYERRDEFYEVCNKFNEMAQRLSEMVKQRQQDESNRRELIAGISHDLRTPLTSIKAYLEGIEKGVASTPEMKQKYFEIIKSKTASLEHLINQLFLFSKLDTGDFPLYLEPVDIAEEIDRTMNVFIAEYAAHGLDIRVRNEIGGAVVMADIVQLRNVIQNVLENSLRYKTKERAIVQIVCTEDAHDVELMLGDDGPGVPEEEMDKLFEVFYRGDASRGRTDLGSGLGLAIASKIIARFGGSIRADHADLGGLAIRIRLPKQERRREKRREAHFDH